MGVLAKIHQEKIIAIVRGIPSAAIAGTARALLRGGIRMMEITFNQESSRVDSDSSRAVPAGDFAGGGHRYHP